MEIRESVNKVVLVGELIAYNNVKQGTGEKGDYISGEAIIKTCINGQELDHKVKFYAGKITSKGAVSKLYTGFQTAVTQDKTREKDGQGDTVQIVASLRENAYAKDGELKVFNEISCKFAPKRVSADTAHAASIEIEGVIRSMEKELVNDRPTDRLTVSIVSIGYGGKLTEVQGVVPAEIVQGFKGLYRPEKTGVLYFDITPVLVQSQKTTQLGFGTTNIQQSDFVKVERVLTGGSVPAERDKAYKIEEIAQLMNARKLRHQEILDKAEKEKSQNLGFGTTGTSNVAQNNTTLGFSNPTDNMLGEDNPFSSNMPF